MILRSSPTGPAGSDRLYRFAAQENGIAAVEFALILPIMLVLWIGGVEVTTALSADRRVGNFAASIGDLVARSKAVSYSEIEDIFDLAAAAMFPFEASTMTMRITAADIDENGDSSVAWSRARNATAYATGTELNGLIPATLRRPGGGQSQVLVAEAWYPYRPSVGYVISGEIDLAERIFLVPRLSTKVQICPSDDDASCVDSL